MRLAEVGVLDQLVKVSNEYISSCLIKMHRLSIIIVVSCGSLPSISNGLPGTPTSTTFGGTGTYSCNTGYVMLGSATVNCEASGGWSTRPTCEGEQ